MFMIILLVIVVLLGVLFYSFLQFDFVGHKDPKIIEENLKRWNNMLLSAEYRNGTDYCTIELLDSVNIDISVGDKTGGVYLNERYQLSGDTIFVQEEIAPEREYLKFNKFLIDGDRVYFLLDSNGNFDTTKSMDVSVSRLR